MEEGSGRRCSEVNEQIILEGKERLDSLGPAASERFKGIQAIGDVPEAMRNIAKAHHLSASNFSRKRQQLQRRRALPSMPWPQRCGVPAHPPGMVKSKAGAGVAPIAWRRRPAWA
ncbi:unnamed protein product [Amoebophrya sp. A120]|nr:unnamed protein product [Amoebophrya sp. A120]|eukprot:GSA120T00012875001.1